MAAHHTEAQRPLKPRHDFPLFAHGCGQWAKKIRGKMRYFGPWGDPKGAQERLRAFIADDAAGRVAIPVNNDQPFRNVVDAYITARHEHLKAGKITLRHYADMARVTKILAGQIDLTRPVNAIGPADWTAVHRHLMGRHGSSTVTRTVTILRGLVKWAVAMGMIDAGAMRFGPDFKIVPAAVLQRAQAARGDRLYSVEQVGMMIEAATQPLKTMVLLAINGGMGNTDLATLKIRELNLAGGFYDSARHKTGVRRRFPLWPETLAGLKEVIANRPAATDPANQDLVFITAFGAPFVTATAVTKGDVVVGAKGKDTVGFLFNQLLLGLGLRQPSPRNAKVGLSDGRGFYTLRRLHRTLADDLKDETAAGLIMGHAKPGIEKHYVLAVPDERLKAITAHIHSKIFPSTPVAAGTAARRRGAGLKRSKGGKTLSRSSGRKR